MADEVPVSQVLCEATEYLTKLGSNLRLRSQNLKEKRISREKLRNTHAVQKAANKVLLICELSKKSLENVENGIRKVLSIISSSQALSVIGGKPEKFEEIDESKFHFFEYESFKLRVSKKVPFKHYTSVKVLASRMPESMQNKYPVYHRCKLYKLRRAERKSIENKAKLDSKDEDYNRLRSSSVDKRVTKTGITYEDLKSSTKDSENHISQSDEEGFKGFSHESTDQGNLMIDRGNLRADKGTKSRSSSPDKIQSKDFGNMYDDSRKQNDETKTKKFRRVQLIDDDVSSSSKEDLVSNTTMDSKSKERNNENTKSDPEDSNKRKLSEHGSEKSGEEETASNHKSKKLKNQNDVQSKSDCRDSDVSENKSKEVKCHESEQRSQQSVELNEVSLNKDDEIYSDSNNERNKPLIKCVSISKLLKPDIVPNYKQSKDKPNNKSKDRTKSTGKSKIFDHKTSQFDEADSEYWDKKRAEVKKFRPKKFSIYISRLPQLTVSFLCSHSLKRITKNDSIICEISKETSPISDNSEKNNYNEIATVNLVGSQDIVPVECTNLNDIKNALLDDSDTENADSIDHNKITENAKVVTESLLAKSDFDKNDKLISSAVVDSENDQPLETGQVKDLQNNKADHTKEIEVEISCARHDNENTDTESTPKKGYVNKTTECDENSPKYNDSITPNGKQISITESMDAKKKLLQTYSSDSDADDKQLKSKIEDIKNSLLNTVSSSDDEKVKKKSSDDSPRKKLLASSGSEDEEVNIQKQKKRLKIKKKRKSKFYDSDKDSSSIEQMDGSVDSKSMKQKKKMGRSKAKPGSSSHSSDTRDDNDVKGLTNLNSLRKTHRRRDSSSTNSSTSENMKSTRSARNMPSAPKIKDDNILAMESSSDAVDDDNGDVEDLPPVSLSGLNGGAIEHLAKDDLLNESDSSSLADKEKSSDDNKKDETIDSDEETSVKLKRRKGQTISSDSEVGSSRKKDRGVKLSDFEDSEDESSEYSKKSKRRKKPGSESDASGGSSDIGTKKRRRIKQVDDSDMSGSDTENEGKNKHGRKNIRKVMGKNQLEEATKKAARQEKERIARIAERQKLYNNMQFDESGKPDEVVLEKVVLDFDPETKEPLIEVDRGLVKKLKPHQANGIKFMWDACFESVKRIKKDKGSGCILAHCMGLGKTLQVVSLTHTLLTLPELTGVNRVLVVCPLSTVLNWVNEFNMWLKYAVRDTDVHVYELSRFKQNSERAYQLTQWFNNGGVCVLGYEMFRNLSADNTKKYKKKMLRQFQESLVDPGPDLVVCDEGHLLKNEKTSLSQSMNKVKTLRRIVLTGTPLQNNLKEYYCMVQFVKPNLLGKYNEYLNRFVNPITNGQYTDSTEHDIRIMKRRSHVLHKMLDGAVQRRDYGVLAPFLPPKHEYVLFITLTEVQVKLYQFYLDNYSRRPLAGKSSGFLFPDFQSLQRIWTHPLVLKYNSERYEIMQQKKRDKEEEDSEGSLVDFIDDDSTPDESTSDESSDDLSDMSDDSRKKSKKKKAAKKSKAKESKVSTRRGTRANPAEILDDDTPEVLEVKNENPTEWWIKMVTDDVLEDMRNSSKLVLLFDILRQCETIGDKLLVFSQSLYSLDLIEHFLGKVDEATQEGRDDPKLGGHRGSWSPGVDYFRLDGSTSCENRSIWCKNFNREDNPRARLFLISTRAGGLGINLVAANRVVIFDVSWNPSHDVQSIFRVYRFGQKKPCYVYRFLAMGTMEEKIYERQVTKQAISKRVIDEQQIDRHYAENDLAELYKFEASPPTPRPIPPLPKDRLFAEMLKEHESRIYKYHEHDSLLENKEEETLTEEERKAAWEDFENEKNRPPPAPFPTWPMHNGMVPGLLAQQQQQLAYAALAAMLRKDMPNINDQQIRDMLPLIYNSNPQMFGGYDYGLMQKMGEIYKYAQPGMMNPMMNPVMNAGGVGGGGSSGLQYEPPWQRQQQQQQQMRLQQLAQHQNSMGAKFYAGGLGSRDPIAMALQQQRAREIMVGERAGAGGGAGRPRGRPPHQPRPTLTNDVVNLADSD